MKPERFTFVKHKLSGERMYVIDTNIIIVRVALETQNPNHPGLGLDVMEIHEEEVEPIED